MIVIEKHIHEESFYKELFIQSHNRRVFIGEEYFVNCWQKEKEAQDFRYD